MASDDFPRTPHSLQPMWVSVDECLISLFTWCMFNLAFQGRISDIWALRWAHGRIFLKVYTPALLERWGGCFELLQRWRIFVAHLTGTTPGQMEDQPGIRLSIIYGLLEDGAQQCGLTGPRKEDAA